MARKKKAGSLIHQSRNIILIFISLASIMIFSAVVELNQSKQELYQLMEEQARALLESLIIASENTLKTNEYLDSISRKRLMNNARLIRTLYESDRISDKILKKISLENDIYRINIYNSRGQKLFRSHLQEHFDLSGKTDPVKILAPIFTGQTDTLIVGLKPARFENGYRYVVAMATKDKGAIVLNIDAQKYLEFKRNIGFGALLRNIVADNNRIIYAALQDTFNILAASGNVRVLEAIRQSDFLTQALDDSLFATRTVKFDTLEVFEAAHPFSFRDITVGLFRLGLSIKPIEEINQRIFRRLILITVVLFVIGSFMLILIFTRQRFSILKTQYEVVETYSGNIISNVSDAIIVSDNKNGIKIFNAAAENLFQQSKSHLLGASLLSFLEQFNCDDIVSKDAHLQQVSCQIAGDNKYLLISRNRFTDAEGLQNIILVIRDLTEQQHLQEQIQRAQRLTAMGALASGVAHEIRNPLNTIGTIIQQLDKDFQPEEDELKQYHELNRVVLSEVKRINETVHEFLRFARPDPIQPEHIKIESFFDTLLKQFQYLLKEKKIQFKVDLKWKGSVLWDSRQIRQVFINIIQNAIEALEKNGMILLHIEALNKKELQIKITDDGPGIPESVRNKIFNLYFTTKASGTGIGLSIVQRIIYEHGGIITVESQPGEGTTFILRLPVKFDTP